MTKTFSIIVPVYNVEKYIDTCIQSILNQTFTDFEVLCVDDCGNDRSMEHIAKYAQKDDRIRILKHNKNRGLSAARNTALDFSCGKYIVCVDSDDWIEPECLEVLYKTFQERQTSSVWIDAYKYDDYQQKRLDDLVSNNTEGYLTITPDNIANLTDYSWIKAYTADSIKKHNLHWPEGLTFEDGEFHFEYFSLNPDAYIIENVLYNYRIREGSIVTNARAGNVKIEDIFQIVRNVREFYIKNGMYEKYKPALLKLVQMRINTCKTIKNNYEKALRLSKQLLEDFGLPENFTERGSSNLVAPLFSIIVPVYKVEKYIEQCISSIIAQSMSDFELICVDDCGRDNSIKIVEKYAKMDSRIRIIYHEKNKGLGGARNTGLKAAKGNFVMVVDSDDWLEPNCLEEVLSAFNSNTVDSVWFKADIWWEEKAFRSNLCTFPYFASYPGGLIKLDDKNLISFPLYSWNKVFKRDFLIKNNFFWPEGVTFEDVLFYFKCFTKAENVYLIDKSLYVYRRREDSIIGNCIKDPKKAEAIFDAAYSSFKYLNESGLLDSYRNSFLRYSVDAINMFRAYPEIQSQLSPVIARYLKKIYFPQDYASCIKEGG